MLQQELDDAYFAEIENHLRQLKFRGGVLISAELGQGNKGVNHILRKPNEDKRGLVERLLSRPPGYTFHLNPRDEAGATALSALRDQGVNLVANALARSTDHILSFFQMLRTELAFYIGALNLRQQLAQLDQHICFPECCPYGSRKLSCSGLYDAALALSAKRKVVANDLRADGRRLIIITGANTGGKSTFMRSIGIAQILMQAGLFVPADSFGAEVHDAILTHYKREEDVTMASGKLDEELARMSEIVDRISPASIVFCNESFAATNEREGSEISRQIAEALIERGVQVVFVTHLFEFARALHEKRMGNVLFLRAERQNDGARTFRIVEGPPLQTSYGGDLYDRVFRPLHQEDQPVESTEDKASRRPAELVGS
jgi:DNA mismatch repair ATPase MutS